MIYKLKPILTYNLWGGSKLSKIYERQSHQYGEAWILSCLGNRNSLVNESTTLKDIFLKNKNIIKCGYKGEFPLLIKFIDAKDDLSIQVHPNSKTEFWYVLNENKSNLYMGFKKDTNRLKVKKILEKGDITKSLNSIKVNKGSAFLINPGTIHAIGKRTFLIEIQRSADVTYRLFDYNRVDKNGKKRELHIASALKVIDYNHLKISTKKSRLNKVLIKCKYFTVCKEVINKIKQYKTDGRSFHSIVVLKGKGVIRSNSQIIKLKPFDSVFIPSFEGKYTIEGKLETILTTL